MAFGQASGPPATAKQLEELLTLLHQHGHADFRDARGPLGFTQRQAAGKFTRDEVAAFIEQLQESETAETAGTDAPIDRPVPSARRPAPGRSPAPKPSTAEQVLRRMPDSLLAAELQRRGWVVMEP